MEVTQSNTQHGRLPVLSGADLSGKEGRLAVLGSTGAVLPGNIADRANYVIDEGAAAGKNSHLIPLEPGRNFRVRMKGTGPRGAVLSLAVIAGDDAGKLRTVPGTAGTYHAIAQAEEAFVDGQLALVRPISREAIVVT